MSYVLRIAHCNSYVSTQELMSFPRQKETKGSINLIKWKGLRTKGMFQATHIYNAIHYVLEICKECMHICICVYKYITTTCVCSPITHSLSISERVQIRLFSVIFALIGKNRLIKFNHFYMLSAKRQHTPSFFQFCFA